ncbi:hypothetical protein PJE062_4435 [Pseudovibrio sp. JE062]|nr:hypothetical protein PJE062_4435 [Pseudovibrio sp. JE062]
MGRIFSLLFYKVQGVPVTTSPPQFFIFAVIGTELTKTGYIHSIP